MLEDFLFNKLNFLSNISFFIKTNTDIVSVFNKVVDNAEWLTSSVAHNLFECHHYMIYFDPDLNCIETDQSELVALVNNFMLNLKNIFSEKIIPENAQV